MGSDCRFGGIPQTHLKQSEKFEWKDSQMEQEMGSDRRFGGIPQTHLEQSEKHQIGGSSDAARNGLRSTIWSYSSNASEAV